MTAPTEALADQAIPTDVRLRGDFALSRAMDPPPQGPPPAGMFPEPDPAQDAAIYYDAMGITPAVASTFSPERIQAMAEPASSAGAGVLLAKLLPAGIGAAVMVAVDPPANKRELFARLFVAFAASYLFGDVVFDLLHSFSLFSFLDHAKRAHVVAVDGTVGALGWSVLGGASMYAKRFRADPVAAVKDATP